MAITKAKKTKDRAKVYCALVSEKLDKGDLFMHMNLFEGTAERSGKKVPFTVSTTGGGSLIVNIGKDFEHRYIVSAKNLMSAFLDMHFETGKQIKVADWPTKKS